MLRDDSTQMRVLVIGVSRSGTTALQAVLAAHPAISIAPRELKIRAVFEEGLGAFFHNGLSSPLREQSIAAAFDQAARIQGKHKAQYLGGKIATGSINEARIAGEAIKKWLPNLKVIHIEREDEVARLGSMMMARFTNRWHTVESKTSSRPVQKLWISKYCLSHSLWESHMINTYFRSLDQEVPYLRVSYEAFAKDNHTVTEHILRFIGLESKGYTKSVLSKTLPDPDQFIDNYHSLCEFVTKRQKELSSDPSYQYSKLQYKYLKFWSLLEKLRFCIGRRLK